MENESATKPDVGSGSSLNLVYRLGGDFSEGIDVASLCPILAAVSDLITTSNNTILATEKEITVRVRPFKEGSFLIDLALQAQAAAQSALAYTNQNDYSNLKTLLECIGLIAGGGAGLLRLIKFLKGKPRKVRKVSSMEFEYTNESENKLVVNGNVHALFQNCTVLATVDRAITNPLKLQKVTSLETYLPGQETETKVQLAKEDVELLEPVTSAAAPSSSPSGQSENRQVVWVRPKTGNYEGAPTSWSFRKIGDQTAFRANLKDEWFLRQLKAGDVRLSGKDALKVELVELQDVEEGKISRQIARVLEYKPAPLQHSLGSVSEAAPSPDKQA